MEESKKLEGNKDFTINLQVGNDNGNSEHDIIINGEQICQPNVCSKVRKLPLLDEVKPEYVANNIEDNLIVTIDSPECEPGIYFAGNYALKSGERIRNIEVGADNSKYTSDVVIVNTLAQIAGYGVREAFKADQELKSDIKIKVDMTTALPISQYKKSTAELFSKRFEGKHKVTVHVGTIRANVEIEFEFVKVLPEGVTAVHALQNISGEIFEEFNKKYQMNIDGEYLKGKKILHIAIGEGTTEYPVTNGIEFSPNFIKGSNNGIGHAIDKSLDEFKDEIGILSYSRQKYSEVLRDKNHKYYSIAADIIDQCIDEQAEEILHYAKNEIQRANNEVDIICVYGGGSIPMREQLEKKLDSICEKADIKLLYIPEKYAVTLESKGMYEFTIGKIFKVLKARNAKTN